MTRRFDKAVALLLAAVSTAGAGWSGFPLADNTNAPTWYAVRQAGLNPVGQVFAAIDERYRAAFGHIGTAYTFTNAYGTVSTSLYEYYRPIITNTITVSAGIETNVTTVAGGLYYADGFWFGYEEPDALGRYYVEWNGEYRWMVPQYVTNGGDQVYIPEVTFTNTAFLYSTVTLTNDFTNAPVTRAVLARLWDYIGAVAPYYTATAGATNVAEYLGRDYHWYDRETAGGSYTNTWYTKRPKAEYLRLGAVFDEELQGFGWEEWAYVAAFGGRYEIDSKWVEGGFAEPATTTLMATARVGAAGAWTATGGGYAPSYVPEWFWFGDTNAARVTWAYTGTNTAPASVTVTGAVWRATWATNDTGWPPDTWGAGIGYGDDDPSVPVAPRYSGRGLTSGITETIAAGEESTNIWAYLHITAVTGGTATPYETLSVSWALHHLAPYRLYAEDLDRMRTALNAMRWTVDMEPDYTAEAHTNGTHTVSVAYDNPHYPAGVSHSGVAASGYYWTFLSGTWWYDTPAETWERRPGYESGFDVRSMEPVDTATGLGATVDYTFTADLGDIWWYFREWQFDYR